MSANLNDLLAAQSYAQSRGMSYDAYGNPVQGRGGGGPVNTTGAGGGPGTLTGANPGGYNPASGGIPGVTSPGVSLDNLIQSISGSAGGIANVINQLTQASGDALRNQYGSDYFNLLHTTTANTQRRAEGDITDLLPELNQNAAERGIGAGVAGSQAYKTKLLRDMGLTRLGVERDALDDLSKIRSNTPVVQPYDVSRLVPSIDIQTTLQQLADILKAAPIPENVYQRTMQNISAGLNNGQNAGYGRGFNGPSGGGGNQTSTVPTDIVQRYAPTGGNHPFGMSDADYAAATKGAGGGWGETWNNGGGDADYSNYSQFGHIPDYVMNNMGAPGPVAGNQPYQYNWMNDPFETAPAGGGGGQDFDPEDYY